MKNIKKHFKLDNFFKSLTVVSFILGIINYLYLDNLRAINKQLELEKLLHFLKKSIEYLGSFDYNDFLNVNNFEPFDSIREIYSVLSDEKALAFMHLSGILGITLCIFSIIAIFYSEKLIIYLKIEEKYHFLARFIKLRRKFQNYYFILNISLILYVLIGMAYVNLSILINH